MIKTRETSLEKDVRIRLKVMKEISKKHLETPEKALEFLVEIGICTKKRKLTKNYRD